MSVKVWRDFSSQTFVVPRMAWPGLAWSEATWFIGMDFAKSLVEATHPLLQATSSLSRMRSA